MQAKPAKSDNYGDEEYWDDRYRSNINHTWYFEYVTLKPLLQRVLKKVDSVLEIGCGDAPLCEGIVNDDHKGVVFGIDFSRKIIDDLNSKQKIPTSLRPTSNSSVTSSSSSVSKVSYQYMDARKLTFDSNSFDVLIDKGTCDAMLSDPNQNKAFRNVKEILSESFRVLRKGVVSSQESDPTFTYQPSHFVLISHMHPESTEFLDFYTNCLVPATLSTKVNDPSVLLAWMIDAHVSEQGDTYGPTVYVISCQVRRSSSRVNSASLEATQIPINIHTY